MAFKKGHKFGKGRIKGSKNRDTILKEERRAMFDNRVSQRWEDTIDKLKPEYIADQFMGKAPDELKIQPVILHIAGEIAKKNDITQSPKRNRKKRS